MKTKTYIDLASESSARIWIDSETKEVENIEFTEEQFTSTITAAIEQAAQQDKQRIEELERMVAMLRDSVDDLHSSFVDYVEGGKDDEVMNNASNALNNSAQSAEVYEKRIKAEMLEEVAGMCNKFKKLQ